MSREKQIEEMANELATLMLRDRNLMSVCDKFYNAGYRKDSDVAREIFAEIEKTAVKVRVEDTKNFVLSEKQFAELKKKYTDG